MCRTSCCCQPERLHHHYITLKQNASTTSRQAGEPGEEVSGVGREVCILTDTAVGDRILIRGQEFVRKGCGQYVTTWGHRVCGGRVWGGGGGEMCGGLGEE